MVKAWQRALLAVLLVAMGLITACSDIQVMEQPEERYPTTSAKELQETHTFQLTIVGVDFDPPLHYAENIRQQGLTLLVAVENQGKERANDVRIIAHLFLDPQKKQVIKRTGVLPRVEPGHMEVYRFPRLRNIPIRHTYILDIQLTTPDGQRVISQRTYKINLSR